MLLQVVIILQAFVNGLTAVGIVQRARRCNDFQAEGSSKGNTRHLPLRGGIMTAPFREERRTSSPVNLACAFRMRKERRRKGVLQHPSRSRLDTHTLLPLCLCQFLRRGYRGAKVQKTSRRRSPENVREEEEQTLRTVHSLLLFVAETTTRPCPVPRREKKRWLTNRNMRATETTPEP